MKTLYMTKGLPASGKTTWARAKLVELGNAKRFNKDDFRAMVDGGRWSKDNEKFILQLRDLAVIQALVGGYHVIIDDTNLASKHEARLRQTAQQHGAAFEVVDFTQVDIEECVERDKKRANYVGEDVIRSMYAQFLRPGPPSYDPTKPWVIICDVDGTVARMIDRGPFEEDRVEEDAVRIDVWNAVIGVKANCPAPGARIAFMSGRTDGCREGTTRWMYNGLLVNKPELYMREVGDKRNDAIVKKELYEKYIAPNYNVRAIFDDRPRVIRMWQSLGFADRIFNVGDGREF